VSLSILLDLQSEEKGWWTSLIEGYKCNPMKPFVPHRDERRQIDDGVAPEVSSNTPHIVVRSLANPVSHIPLHFVQNTQMNQLPRELPAQQASHSLLPACALPTVRIPHAVVQSARAAECSGDLMQSPETSELAIGCFIVGCQENAKSALQSRSYAVNRDDKATICTCFAESRP
jgi:hypothetical protein